MSGLAWFTALFMSLFLAAVFIMLSESYSWSSSATTWGLTAILAVPLAIDFALWRRRKRSGRRRDGGDGTAHPAK